jgi:hypothetical protein
MREAETASTAMPTSTTIGPIITHQMDSQPTTAKPIDVKVVSNDKSIEDRRFYLPHIKNPNENLDFDYYAE